MEGRRNSPWHVSRVATATTTVNLQFPHVVVGAFHAFRRHSVTTGLLQMVLLQRAARGGR